MSSLAVAAVQFAPVFADPAANVKRVLRLLASIATRGAGLVVFPECALTGYCFESREEAQPAALRLEGPELASIAAACTCTAIVGFAERMGDTLYNSAAILGPGSVLGVYRKCHLPLLGLDRFVEKGDALPVFDTPAGRIGVLICYDVRIPEAALSLALRGVEVIAVPTNWPEGAEASPDVLVPARAWDTRAFFVAANRVGEERGFRFIGKSGVWGPNGKLVASAHRADEEIVTAEVDLSLTYQKRIVIRPGEFEMDPLGDRRPELYGL